ncbi:MAG: polyphosphate--AMP phosphotransferase, partial [Eggerthellaceae bacterium]
MLENVDFKRPHLSKTDYKAPYKEAINELVVLQQQVRQAEIGLVVLFEGWAGAGKGSCISDLMYHLDARATSVHETAYLDEKDAKHWAKNA